MRKKIAGLIMTLSAGNALALGLGEVSGQAVIGQPLRIEIPVLGSDGNLPAASCFRVRPPMTDIGTEFVLRNTRIQVVGERGATRLILTHNALVREPVIGFAVAVGCGFELSKDYILLAAFPTDTQPEVTLPQPAPAPRAAAPAVPVAAAPAAAAPAAPVVAAPVPAAVAPTPPRKAPPAAKPAATTTDKALRLDRDATLEDLAQQKYPLQPKAREKFMRMMAQANPELKANDAVIAAGTELQVPPGLPQRRVGPYLGEGVKEKPAAPAKSPAPAETPAAVAAAPAAPTAKPAGKDRLVVGGGPEMSEAKLLAEAERLTAILVEQTKSQDAVTETIARLEDTYGELQKRFVSMDDRLKRIEVERQAEKAAPKPVSFDFVELLIAVIAGGAIGGLLLHLFQRLQPRRGADAESELPVASAAPAIKTSFKLPWVKRATPEPAAPVVVAAAAAAVPAAITAAEAVAEEAAEPVPQVEAVAAATPAVEAPAPTSIPEFLKPKPATSEAPLTAEPPAAEPLTNEPPTAESPTAASPATESPAGDDLDALSLDFPLMPEPVAETPATVAPELAVPELAAAEAVAPEAAAPDTPVPEVVAAAATPTIVEPPSLEPLTLDFPMIPESKPEEPQAPALPAIETAAESPAPTIAEAPALESLALDFPEIPTAAAAAPDDGHVIEFEPVAKAEAGQNTLDFSKR